MVDGRAAHISVRGLVKEFGSARAVDNVGFDVPHGEMVTLLGPSGCGKTTTLRCIAGIDRPDQGEIVIGDQVVNSSERNVYVSPENRCIGMVFQSYALWSHMSVWTNVAYPLQVRRTPRKIIQKRVAQALNLVGLGAYGQRTPAALSGGRQQRVALARALVYEPQVLLLDEPLSNLDAQLRETMRGRFATCSSRSASPRCTSPSTRRRPWRSRTRWS